MKEVNGYCTIAQVAENEIVGIRVRFLRSDDEVPYASEKDSENSKRNVQVEK